MPITINFFFSQIHLSDFLQYIEYFNLFDPENVATLVMLGFLLGCRWFGIYAEKKLDEFKNDKNNPTSKKEKKPTKEPEPHLKRKQYRPKRRADGGKHDFPRYDGSNRSQKF